MCIGLVEKLSAASDVDGDEKDAKKKSQTSEIEMGERFKAGVDTKNENSNEREVGEEAKDDEKVVFDICLIVHRTNPSD